MGFAVSGSSVTVLMPIAPRAAWLARSLATLRLQTLTNWSLLAVLDGDCEQNRSTLSESGLGPRTTVVAVPEGTGVAGALNMGLQISDAEYVARLDADDECLPSRLEQPVEAMSMIQIAAFGTGPHSNQKRVANEMGHPTLPFPGWTNWSQALARARGQSLGLGVLVILRVHAKKPRAKQQTGSDTPQQSTPRTRIQPDPGFAPVGSRGRLCR